jgi:hypothetical protein
MARTVTELLPTRSGIAADQAVVPVATPAVPKLVAQETSVTPTLSLAVPAMVTEAVVVDMVPVEGVVMVKAGAVVSGGLRLELPRDGQRLRAAGCRDA